MRKYCRDEDIPWRSVSELPLQPGVTEEMRESIVFRRLSEGDGWYISDSRMPPGSRAPLHSHSEGEFSYILEVSCTMDDGTELRAGDGFVATANQVYGMQVGPDGLRFLAIRNGEFD